jgi:hypothetical protein
MPATPEARARTRAFARVIGPSLVIVPAIVAVRAPETGATASAFFQNEALVWITGGWLLFAGLLIIANHQYWSGLSAILISLFGWFLALRGVALLAAPQLYASATSAALNVMPVVQTGFGVLVLIGLWLTFAGWIAKSPAAALPIGMMVSSGPLVMTKPPVCWLKCRGKPVSS